MKKKIIILLFIMLVFSGCTPSYNITIKDSRIEEELIINEDYNGYSKRFNELNAIVETNQKYNVKYNNTQATFKYDYNFTNFNESNLIKSCYESFILDKEDNKYILKTGLRFNCYPLQISDYEYAEFDSLKINIKVMDYKVIENNADYINNNIYSWIINENNYENKPIVLKFEKKEVKKDKKDNVMFYIGSLISIILVGGFLITFIIILLKKNNNKL